MKCNIKKQMNKILLFGGVLFSFMGCNEAKLQDPGMKGKQATVQCVSPGLRIIKYVGIIKLHVHITSKKVPLGKNVISLKWRGCCDNNRAIYSMSPKIWFIAEEGKTYNAKCEVKQGVRFWLEDAETGKRVGGIKGSVDEPADNPKTVEIKKPFSKDNM